MKIAVFISYDYPYRLYRFKEFKKELEKNFKKLKPYFFLPAYAANEMTIKIMEDYTGIGQPSLLPSEHLNQFDFVYLDLNLEDITSWMRGILKRAPKDTIVFQFITTPEPKYFLGDLIVIPYRYSKIELNRYFYNLFRTGKLTSFKDITKNDFFYTNLKNVFIFVGPSFLPHTSFHYGKESFWDGRESFFFYNYLFEQFEGEVLKIFNFIQDAKVSTLYLEENPFWKEKVRRRFEGLMNFLKNSSQLKVICSPKGLFYEKLLEEPYPKKAVSLIAENKNNQQQLLLPFEAFMPVLNMKRTEVNQDNFDTFFFRYRTKEDFVSYLSSFEKKNFFEQVLNTFKENFWEEKD